MRLNYSSSLLFLLILIGCSRSDRGTEIPEGHLELVWAIQPEEPSGELWFGQIWGVSIWKNQIIVGDYQRTTLIVLDNRGSFIRTIGRKGSGPGEFAIVRDPTISPNGRIFVVRGPLGVLSEFSPDGMFHKVSRYRDGLAGTGFSGIQRPLALDDSTVVFDVSIGQSDPIEEQLKVPLLIACSGDGWIPLAYRSFPPEINEERLRIVDSPDQTLVWPFTELKKCRGLNSGEVIVVRIGDPFTIRRVGINQPVYSFSFLDIQSDEFVRIMETPTEEYWTSYSRSDARLIGEYPIQGKQIPSQTMRAFTFANSCRGLAVVENKLVIFVEVLSEDFQNVSVDQGIEQKLYVVNLDTEQAEMILPFHYPHQIELQGALEDGTLIFSTNDPVPGILAYRILEPN